jgi:glycosyltransferase involved in cell wall biosynthesis
MRVLFVHQNFPGQFRYSATALAADSRNEVIALCINPPGYATPGVKVGRYPIKRQPVKDLHPLIMDFQSKIIRGEAAAAAAAELKRKGFQPDVVVVHPGWGEQMFLKDVWPDVPVLSFMEFYYRSEGLDSDFDPEFHKLTLPGRMRTRTKNANHLLALEATDWAYSPTQWQRASLPQEYHDRTSVIFDGIDTGFIQPKADAVFTLADGRSLSAGDEVLTFVNRNLEPYRGFHIFMRALAGIQKQRPNAITLMVGGDEVSYGTAPANGADGKTRSWRDVMMAEVGDKLDMSRVVFLGRIPYANYRTLLQVSRVHAYLTYPFVLSWSMLESLAAECLVVGSSTPPVMEVLHDGKNGLAVDFFDIDGWVSTISKALAKPDDYTELRRQARRDILSQYDLNTICLPRQLRLIHAVAERRSADDLKAI